MLAYRFVQTDPDHADFEVVPGPAFGPGAEQAIVASIAGELGDRGLSVSVVAVAAIERGTGGKRSTIMRRL